MDNEQIKKIREIMLEIFEERRASLDVVKFKSPTRAFAVAGIDLIYNYMKEVMESIEMLDSSRKRTESNEKVDMYKCQSIVEGGVVKNCTCGSCF